MGEFLLVISPPQPPHLQAHGGGGWGGGTTKHSFVQIFRAPQNTPKTRPKQPRTHSQSPGGVFRGPFRAAPSDLSCRGKRFCLPDVSARRMLCTARWASPIVSLRRQGLRPVASSVASSSSFTGHPSSFARWQTNVRVIRLSVAEDRVAARPAEGFSSLEALPEHFLGAEQRL